VARKFQHSLQCLARGLAVLESFAEAKETLTLTELAQLTGMNKTAVQRHTDTLVELGYLGRNKHKEFHLSHRVLALGHAYSQKWPLRPFVATSLADLSERTGLTSSLSILDGTEVLLMSRATRRFLQYNLHVGSRLPSHCTAAGKVLLAALTDEDLSDRLKKMDLERLTSATITSREALLDDLAATRRRGYGISNRELTLDLVTVSVPVLNEEDTVEAALIVSLRADEADAQALEKAVREASEEGRKLSQALGYRGAYPAILRTAQK
jgi:IclR family pca regulon transcriptional regulator